MPPDPPAARRNSRWASILAPVAALMAAMISIQFGATLAEGLFPRVGAQGATALRLGIAALLLALLRRPWRGGPVPRAAWPALAGYGLSLGTMNLLFYMAIRTIPLGVAVALEFSGPLLVATLSTRRPADFAWVGLAAIGLLALSPLRGAAALDPAGVALALGAGACWALYMIFGKRAGAALGSRTTALGSIIAACVALPVGANHAGAALVAPSIALPALLVGIFSSALPYSLEMVALTRLPARVYGTLTSLEPAIGAFMGALLLQDRLTAGQWLGIGAVVAASFGAAATMKEALASPE